MIGNIASDEFRNGASSGAMAVAYRARVLEQLGIPLDAEKVAALAAGIDEMYHGVVFAIGALPPTEDEREQRADDWDSGWAALAHQEHQQHVDSSHPITRANPFRRPAGTS